jgi:AcrR family transcriptional regulator
MSEKMRRTQAERRQGTRKQLLDAAIDCLVEHGYSGTTTTEIADRAGVSRGAQLHHFPTKADLLSAALEHLFQRRHEEYLAAIARLPPGTDRLTASIEQLWGVLSGPTFYAWLELIVAARTDAALRRSISGVADRFAATVDVSFKNQFPDAIGTPFFEVAPGFTFALLQGLALENILEGTLPHNRIERVLSAFRDISRLVLPDAQGAAKPRPRRTRS